MNFATFKTLFRANDADRFERKTARNLAQIGCILAMPAGFLGLYFLLGLVSDHGEGHRMMLSAFAVHMALGFMVCVGWILRARWDYHPILPRRLFWVASLLHHSVWVAFYVWLATRHGAHLMLNPLNIWFGVNIALASYFILLPQPCFEPAHDRVEANETQGLSHR